ncbi:hypothetical protein [Brachybacterium paraconglomeratum]|uniref:hypothetical protein n=1 Tax=Brachybacterium paraconglomeratum TaxID=173362 RepID=UPI002490A186|nr:hypothetical protein [Brachybacterium paraconglomeratum]
MREKPPRDAKNPDEAPSGGFGAASPPRITPVLEPMRLLSSAGAMFALIPVPVLSEDEGLLVDIELLSPDRLVRYLARRISSGTVRLLVDALIKAAVEPHPELTVPTVQDDVAGLAILVKGSTNREVLLEILVVDDLESDLPDHDGVSFDVARKNLIDAAHQLEEWNR